jgi:hypothetical protein
VWSENKKYLSFDEVDHPDLSGRTNFFGQDAHAQERKVERAYKVETVTLERLLKEYKAPRKIDYLSIDTEGSEYEILKNFDFNQYQFGCISIEHNFTPQRLNIYELLILNGYRQVYSEISQFDDWYVYESKP